MRERHRVRDPSRELGFERLRVRLREHAVGDQARAQDRDRVALLPLLDLGLLAVDHGNDQPLGVLAVAVGLRLDQGRAVAATRARDRLGDDREHRLRVLPVDHDARDAVAGRAVGDVLDRDVRSRAGVVAP